MSREQEIKESVRSRYSTAAKGVAEATTGCCGTGAACSTDLYEQEEVEGLPAEAVAASLGCGNPVALADLKPGEVVLDLGSGGGIDVLLSAKRVGPRGKAYGLDMTDEMLDLARQNQRRAGVANAEFLKGEMEAMPLPEASVDVVISNCVVNLSPDKERVLREAFRVLRPGGRLAIADIVALEPVDASVRRDMALWSSCVAGALEQGEYVEKLAAAGFTGIQVEVLHGYDAGGGGEGSAPLPRLASCFVRAVKPKA
ncbi:MAG: arsenite methyltransferase [Dehalococcoidia bacterium]